MSHDFLATYSIKAIEYLTALTFLVSFAFFWRFVNGGRKPQPQALPTRAREPAPEFDLPDSVWLHPGHAWARLDGKLATVGADDFAHRLVGPVGSWALPKVGARVGQGEPAFTLEVGGKAVRMLSPVDGEVVAVNDGLGSESDPYGGQWLFKVEPIRPEANAKQLLKGPKARKYLHEIWEDLRQSSAPDVGAVMQDGGAPVAGLAQALDPEHWDRLAARLFLTDAESGHV